MKTDSETSGLLANVTRGDVVESRHFGHLAVVDGTGRLLAQIGNPELVTFLRSSAKPFQAIPLITSGAADYFGFSESELALACGSHSGEPIHTAAAGEMLRKAGIERSALKCGVHEPFNQRIAREQQRAGSLPDVLQNNCSGKHAGMLAVTKYLREPIELYIFPDSSVQRAVRDTISQFSGLPREEIRWAVDGCSVPTFALPVWRMALMFARLVVPETLSSRICPACARIVSAMMAHPEMVAGENELDTELMRRTRGRLVSKIGAEGVFAAGVSPCVQWPNGLGVAFKIEDGSARARSVVAIEVLRQLEVLKGPDVVALSAFSKVPISSRQGKEVGSISAALTLKRNNHGAV